MITGRVIAGNAVAGVMVSTPAGGLVMANWIRFVPPVPLANVMAARSEPAPVSLVVVTVNVVADRLKHAKGNPRKAYRIECIFIKLRHFWVTSTVQESAEGSF